LAFLTTLREILYWIAVGENAVAQQVVDATFRVHTSLGPGLLESVYETALAYELEKRGLSITRQQGIPVVYEAVRIHAGFSQTWWWKTR
jgi:GxxExxY protein